MCVCARARAHVFVRACATATDIATDIGTDINTDIDTDTDIDTAQLPPHTHRRGRRHGQRGRRHRQRETQAERYPGANLW